MTVADRLSELGIELPKANPPIANYLSAVNDSGVLYLAGHVPRKEGRILTGRVGADVTTEQAADIARGVTLDILATIEAAAGLDRVLRVIKINGYIRSAVDYGDQPAVLNGASDLLVEVFGEARGKHARAAVGVAELPSKAILEIDGIFRIADA